MKLPRSEFPTPKGNTPKGNIKRDNKIGQFFGSTPAWLLFVLTVAICALTAYAGSLTAQYRLKSGAIEAEGPIGTAVAATLGLLAFMLGFTFSLTVERYTERKNLVLQHANAIGTCYLRTSFIPDRQKVEIQNYLREYVTIMLELHKNADIEKLLTRINQLQLLIWRQTVSLAQEDMDGELRTFFSGSVNDVLNAYYSRKTVSLIFRIPDGIWVALLFLTVTGMFSYGYQNGITGMSHIYQMPLLAASFSMVVVLIAKMDSVGWQRLQVSYEPFLNVQEMIEQEAV